MDIRCDNLSIGNEELETFEDIDSYDELHCTLDVDYITELKDKGFHLCLTFYIKIKNKDADIIVYHIPYTLIYSLEKYESNSLDTLLKSAVHEVGMQAYSQFALIGTIYFQKKLVSYEKKFH